jgi:phosphatidylserine/phosphatidylglycerophosphate/cardiolipin synthase-like enzyme
MNEWLNEIQQVIDTSPWCRQHRYNSFAPIRHDSNAQWFIDGKDYFAEVADRIEAAQSVIYIEDWWLTPELYLKRPPSQHPEYRLDTLLKRKAEQGIRIYVIIYKEVSYALGIDSYYTKSKLQALHPNIRQVSHGMKILSSFYFRVLRYPDHAPGGILYWALHDKIVVIDEEIAFVGGLDLCLGRYDSSKHSLADDLESIDEEWPGMDYSNPVGQPL